MTQPPARKPNRASHANWEPYLALIAFAVGIIAGILDGISR
ncbi:hypothetical protein [Dactylosporangium darangshiense]|uniref:Uncharacterized protein n=1 Tax=Dactylosporangium darangshiense TaxID=579108 RepID=A0ABP8DMR1_9ACTN